MARHHEWLHGELARWTREGLMSTAQAESIGRRYPLESGIAWGQLILSSFGAIIFGLGIVLLFAYNWEAMHKFAKLGVIIGALIAAHLAAMALRRPDHSPAASEGLHALGTMLFGAGIWLVAQIYHLDEHYPNAILLWGIGALAFAWALPSLTQSLMAVALVVVWQLTEVFDFDAPLHSAAWVLLLGIFPLVWRFQSAALAGAATSALFSSLALTSLRLDDDMVAPVLMFAAAAAVATGRLAALYTGAGLARTERAFLIPGFGTILLLLYILSFPDAAESLLDIQFDSILESAYFFTSAVVSMGLWTILLVSRSRQGTALLSWSDGVTLLSVALLLLFTLVGFALGDWIIAAPFNLLLLGISLVLILEGSRNGDRRKVLGGCLLLALLAASRYVDLFESLITRALVFFLVGGILFAVGNRYSRHKERNGETS